MYEKRQKVEVIYSYTSDVESQPATDLRTTDRNTAAGCCAHLFFPLQIDFVTTYLYSDVYVKRIVPFSLAIKNGAKKRKNHLISLSLVVCSFITYTYARKWIVSISVQFRRQLIIYSEKKKLFFCVSSENTERAGVRTTWSNLLCSVTMSPMKVSVPSRCESSTKRKMPICLEWHPIDIDHTNTIAHTVSNEWMVDERPSPKTSFLSLRKLSIPPNEIYY